MKHIWIIGVLLFISGWGWSQDTDLAPKSDDFLVNRLQVQEYMKANLQETFQDELNTRENVKSVGRSILYSAILPGSGQYYAKSYLKSVLFVAVEVGALAMNRYFVKEGDRKTDDFEKYADEHWNEERYWSYVYHELNRQRAALKDKGINLPTYHPVPDELKRGILPHDEAVRAEIYFRELFNNPDFRTTDYLPGFTHELPETKTQQYYEMIGKYPSQFGNAWSDADFKTKYDGYQNINTPINGHYSSLRDGANRLYHKATIGGMVLLINHLLSAVDAGFTTQRYNKQMLKISYENQYYNGESINMVGININW